jgi:hypothetical protein
MTRNLWRVLTVVSVAAAGAAACGRPDEAMWVRSLPPAPMVTELPAPAEDAWPPDYGPLRNATVTVPGWGAGVTACHTGRLQLSDGYHSPGPGPVTQLWIESYVAADVDRDGTADYVAVLRCGEGPEAPGWQVVAFRHSGDEFTPIGRVIGSQDGLPILSGLEARAGGRIAVYLGREYVDYGDQFTPHQWRVFGFDAGRFRQVDGPTSFPPNPPAARLSVDQAELAFRTAQGGVLTAELAVTVRNSGDAGIGGARLTISLPAAVHPAGSAWTGCTEARHTGAPAVVFTCPVGPIAAQSTWVNWLQVVTEPGYRPAAGTLGVRQVPPYTYEIAQNSEADIRILRA